MTMEISASPIIEQVNAIANLYFRRDAAIKTAYGILRMDSTNEHEDMEEFTANDPRTLWNMSTYLLTPRPPQFELVRKDGSTFGRELRVQAQRVQEFFARKWSQQDRIASRQGKTGFMRPMVGGFLSTGWLFMPYSPEGFVDMWPANSTYPVWSDFGLSRLARKRSITIAEAYRRAAANGWELPRMAFGSATVTEYHMFQANGPEEFSHAVAMNTQVVKPWTVHAGVIPVVATVAGGLPGDRELDSQWPSNIGQSVLSTNEKVYTSQNRQHTFLQQMIRDTANPRWFEQSSGNPILRPEDMFKRGAVFRGGVNDAINALAVPPIPVEARSSLFDVSNMIQRGGVSDVTFGNVQQSITAALMSQAADSTAQLLDPYKTQIEFGQTEVTDAWWRHWVNTPALRPDWMRNFDDGLFQETEIISTYTVKIPGDLSGRILMAKSLNPRWEMSEDRISDMLFPEITNKEAERAAKRADLALRDPSFMFMAVIQVHEAKADIAARAGDVKLAKLHTEFAEAAKMKAMEAIGTPMQPQGV